MILYSCLQIINHLYINNSTLNLFMKISLWGCSTTLKNQQKASFLKTTGNSLAFKTIGRDKNAPWSNRILKDSYDLQYQIFKPQNTPRIKTSKNWYRMKRKQSLPINSIKKVSNQVKQIPKTLKYINKIDFLSPKISPSKKIKIPKDEYSTVDTSGLCRFEYKKTISGKTKFKSNNHYDFNNQTQRSVNQYPFWHNPTLQLLIQKPKMHKMKQKMHSFSSYTERKVFEPKDQLDKIYNIQQCYPKTTPAFRTKKFVCMEKLSHPKQTLNITSMLDYDVSVQPIKEASPSFTISKSQRQLQFSRQVISPERGCYR